MRPIAPVTDTDRTDPELTRLPATIPGVGRTPDPQRLAPPAVSPGATRVVTILELGGELATNAERAATDGGRLERYRMGDELGRGGMGVVRQADDPALRRAVAVKLLAADSDAARARFVEEAQITGQLEHPNIVPVHELGCDDAGRPYLAMKCVRGRTLRDAIHDSSDARQRWSENAADFLDIFGKVCDAIGYAHSHGVIHRDLKPENIMIGDHGEVLVMDWGLARPTGVSDGYDSHATLVQSDRREEQPDQTIRGDVFGTPAFMAPEQARGETDRIDERSDVFGLGAVLYAMLTLRPPYEGRDTHSVLHMASRRACPSPRKRATARRVPRELDAIAMMAMASDPADRYATVQQLKADVQAHGASRPVLARRDGPLTRAAKWSRRNPTGALSGVFLLVLALVVSQLYTVRQAAILDEERARHAQELAEARAGEAEARASAAEAREGDLQGRVRDTLSRATSHAIDDFLARRAEAFRSGLDEAAFAASLDREQLGAYRQAFDDLFRVLDEIGAEPTAEQWFDRAVIRGYAGDVEGAIEDYGQGLQLAPDALSARIRRANLLRDSGKVQQAIDAYRQIMTTHGRHADLYLQMGVAYELAGDVIKARWSYDVAIDTDPGQVDARINRGVMYWKTFGDPRGGMHDIDIALRLNGNAAHGWHQRGLIKAELGDLQGALADLDRAIAIRPDLLSACESRGKIRLLVGDNTGATIDFDTAAGREPADAQGWVDRGNYRNSRGNHALALRDFDRALALQEKHLGAFIGRATARYGTGDYYGSMRDWQAAIELSPDDATLHYRLGMATTLRRNLEGAIDTYTKALELEPRMWQAQFRRGELRVLFDQHREAGIADLQAAYRACAEPAFRDRIRAILAEYGATVPD